MHFSFQFIRACPAGRRLAARTFGVIAAAAIVCAPAWAQTSAGTEAEADPDLQLVSQIDELAERIVATGQVPGMAITLTRGQTVLLSKGYGVRVAGTTEAVNTDTQFRIASLSKTFTASLVGVLVDRGFAQWDDTLPTLVPGFQLKNPQAAEHVTLEGLLSHRTGLPYHALDQLLEASDSPLDVRAAMPTVRLACQPGDCFGYQNVAFAYAADAVFASSGTFFDVALRRELLVPLGMHRTTVGRDAFIEEENRALPHVWSANGQKAVEPKPNYYWLPAAAGVNSSIRDMSRWLLAQQGYRPEVLDPELLEVLHEPRVDTPGEIAGSHWRRARLTRASYALGFRVLDYQGHPMIFHAGAVEGFRAVFAYAADLNTGMVMLWNSNSNVPAGLLPTAFDHWFELPAVDWVEIDKVKVLAVAPAAAATTARP